VKNQGKRLQVAQKFFREIAAPLERAPHPMAQATVASLDPLRVLLPTQRLNSRKRGNETVPLVARCPVVAWSHFSSRFVV